MTSRQRIYAIFATPALAIAFLSSTAPANSAPSLTPPAVDAFTYLPSTATPALSLPGASSSIATATATAKREVRAQYMSADGITHATVFDVADGYTADQAYILLKGQGVKGLQNPSQQGVTPKAPQGVMPSSTPPEGSPCSYGTAHSIQCPPVKVWARNGYTNPQIYYWDHTGSRWPVGTAITKWNQSPNIHVAWAPGGCPGGSAYHCVDVTEAHNGANGTYGYTSWQWTTNSNPDYFINGTVNIQFNDDMYTNNLTIACHEIGHSFGMDHNDSSSSCMYSAGNLGASAPNSADYSLITAVLYSR
ncbi:MAG: matrixin family metalloprotease [Lapillicoccus sp.]